jgi:hypothetical protein
VLIPLLPPPDDHIRLLFDIQDELDALTASYEGPPGAGGGGGGSWDVTLADVCLRPLGSACATQSVLQYWGMSRDVFEHGGGRRAAAARPTCNAAWRPVLLPSLPGFIVWPAAAPAPQAPPPCRCASAPSFASHTGPLRWEGGCMGV